MTVKELYDSIGGNYEGARRILQNDAFIGRFVVRILEDASFSRLTAAAEAGDEREIFEAAHAMKGVCANLGLDQLSRAAGEITEAFRPGKPRTMDRAALTEQLQNLRALYERTVAGVRAFSESQG